MNEMKETEKKDPEPPETWDRCHAYMKQKKRFCRQQRQNDSIYCGNHQHLQVNLQSKRKRIPCPLDPSHMIYEDQLNKHLPICPKTKKRKRQEDSHYYKENVNAGGHGDISCPAISPTKTDTHSWAQKLALRVLMVHQQVFGNSATKDVTKLTFSDLHDAIEMRDFSRQEMDAGIEKGFQSHRIKAGGSRHVPQIASLVGHLRDIEAIPRIQTTKGKNSLGSAEPLLLLEMGAGRGMFGLTASGVAGSAGLDTHLMMVERTGTRGKADKIFRSLAKQEESSSYLELDKVKWSRINCDLLHIYLPDLLEKDYELKRAKVVVIAKHLCGVGTDLALKAMEPIKERVSACVLATCCHGVCNWCDYVGRGFLCEKMKEEDLTTFGEDEFNLMRQWCAGAVACQDELQTRIRQGEISNTDDQPEEVVEHSVSNVNDTDATPIRVNISAIVSSLNLACGVQGLGRACQRLIDYGRSEYLRNIIYENQKSSTVNLCHYIPNGVTPQNAVLVACKKGQN